MKEFNDISSLGIPLLPCQLQNQLIIANSINIFLASMRYQNL